MKQSLDLDAFAKILTDKGYDGYFHTEAGYADKIKDSISRFLEACKNGMDQPMLPNTLMLTTYLQWNGDDSPKIECNMWVRYEDGLFDLQKMNIERTDRYGQLLKQSKLTDLSVITAPKAVDAIALVNEAPKQKAFQSSKRFRL